MHAMGILANLDFLKCRTSKRNLQDYLTFCRTYSIAVLILYACVYKVWLLFSGTSPFICRAVVKFMQICRTVLQNQGQLASMHGITDTPNIVYTAASPSGVMDVILAAGPVPALVMALTLNVYKVKDFKPVTSTEVSSTEISREEPGPTTCTAYPVMTPFRSSVGRGVQESSAVVGSL